jgi:hypothetical protein
MFDWNEYLILARELRLKQSEAAEFWDHYTLYTAVKWWYVFFWLYCDVSKQMYQLSQGV